MTNENPRGLPVDWVSKSALDAAIAAQQAEGEDRG